MKNDFVIGKSLKELSLEEMQLVYGGTDGADPRSTIICSATVSFIASYLGSAQTSLWQRQQEKIKYSILKIKVALYFPLS